MKQKFLFLSFLIILSCVFVKANAKIVTVSALDKIAAVKPVVSFSNKFPELLKITNEQNLISNVIITEKVIAKKKIIIQIL